MPRPRSERRSWPAVVAVGLLLPVLYVLSVGPAAATLRWAEPDSTFGTFEAAYAPLRWLNSAVPPIGEVIRWYASLWLPENISLSSEFHLDHWLHR